MIRIGLTGNAASGKTEVAKAWGDAGVPVVSADELAREAVAPGSEGLREVVAAFGPGVLAADGSLDRGRLRRIVFGDPEARARLEEILHPRIRRLRDAWLRERGDEGAAVVAGEIPLLFEAGLEEEFDVIVVVHAPEEERRRRLVEGRGLPPREAEALLASQGDPDEKARRADHVLVNDGSLDELRSKALALLDRIREEG